MTSIPPPDPGLSGLDFVRSLAAGNIPPSPLAAFMPFAVTELAMGRIVLQTTPGPEFINVLNTVHGGWIMTMLDTAMALAARTTMAPGETGPSHETAVKFLRPILPGTGPLRIHGTVLTKGRTLVAVEGRIDDATGRLYAHATSTCVIVKPG